MNKFETKRKNIFFLTILSFFPFLIIISNLKRSWYHCINANDFSIYQQGIYELASSSSWNPYLTIRNLKIFNDHADPIIVLAAFFVKIFGYTTATLLTFEWLWFLSLLLVFYFLKRFKSVLDPEFLFSLVILLFSRSLLQGVEFPIHPTTWSILPCFLLMYFVTKNNFKGLIITSVAICLFREIFPFMIIGLSGYFFFNKRWKEFVSLFIIGSIFLFILFYLRPKFLGPTLAYGDAMVHNLLTGHIFYIWERFALFTFHHKIFTIYLIPLIMILIYEVKNIRNLLKHPLMACFFFVFPMFFLHMLAGRFEHHLTIPMIAPFLSIFLFSSIPAKITKSVLIKKWRGKEYKLNSALIVLLLLPPISSASSRYTRMVKTIFFDKHQTCLISKDKKVATRELYKHLLNLPLNKNIIASGGLIQAMMRPGQQLYQFAPTSRVMDHYEYLAMEKNGNGDIIPLNVAHTKTIISKCRSFAKNILVDNSYYILMQGDFTQECLEQRKRFGRSPYLPSDSIR